METLLIPFEYEYMLKAILVSGLVGGVCGCLSCYVILKGWSLLGDGLSHAVVPGVAVAYKIGWPFAIGAYIAGLSAAGLMGYLKSVTRVRQDAIIGVVYTAYFAAGLVILSLFPTGIKVKTIVFGNILGIADSDIWQMVIVATLALVVLLAQWKDLLLYCFDASHARAIGLSTWRLEVTLLTLMAGVAIAALQTIGAAMVMAMLITPGATAYLLTNRFGVMMILASSLGVVTSIIGAYLSYHVDGSTGGVIVVLQTLVFLTAFFFAPRKGLIANRIKAKAAIEQTQAELEQASLKQEITR